MNDLSNSFHKAIFTLYKRLPGLQKLTPTIRSGFLKGMRWSASSVNTSYLIGTYELDAVNKFQESLKSDGVLYDIGANVGFFSLVGSKIIGSQGKVYAFEPMPENLLLLTKHIKINGVKNVEIVPKAVCEKSGPVTFTHSENLAANTYIANSPMFELDKGRLTVEGISLDQHLDQNPEFLAPTLIKIDVEGAEFDVLSGAQETLIKHKPAILLATHDNHLPGVKDKCLELITSIGYAVTETEENKIPGQQDFFATHPEKS